MLTRPLRCFAAFGLFACVAVFGAGVVRPDPGPSSNKRQALADERAKVARRANEQLFEASRQGTGALPSLENVYLWSRRVLEAELDAAQSDVERRAAYERHLGRMKELEDRSQKANAAGIRTAPIGQTTAELFRLEGEFWLERARVN